MKLSFIYKTILFFGLTLTLQAETLSKEEKILYDIVSERVNILKYSEEEYEYFKPLELNSDEASKEAILFRENELWIFQIEEKNIVKISQTGGHQLYKYFDQIKMLLYKKNVKVPIEIKEVIKDGYKVLSLPLLDGTFLTFHYSKNKKRYIREKTEEQQKLIDILDEFMFQPLTSKYLTGEEENRRIKETKERFEKITKKNPLLLRWLIELEDYEHKDSYSFYYKTKVLSLELIDKFDKTGELLFSIASSDTIEWYVRRDAINFLDKRTDIKHLKKLIAYLPSMKTSEIYNATIEAFAHHHIDEALDMIIKTSQKSRMFSEDEILQVRAKLGDISTLHNLMAQQHNPYPWAKREMQESLKILVEQVGEKEVLSKLHKNYKSKTVVEQYKELYEVSNDANISYWALKRYNKHHQDNDFLINALNHDDWYIRDYAAQKLIETKESIDKKLRDKLKSKSFNNRAKYWIVYILIKRNQDVSEWIKNIKDIKIELPTFIDQKLRETIVKASYKNANDKTDIRWIIEGLMLDKNSEYIVEDENTEKKRELKEMKRVAGYLKDANISMDSMKAYSEIMHQGSSTFYVFSKKISVKNLEPNEEETRRDEIHVSTVGKYAIHRVEVSIVNAKEGSGSRGYDKPIDNNELYKKVLEKAGYIMLSQEQRDFVFPRLYSYYFRYGEKLSVEEHLFYWQD